MNTVRDAASVADSPPGVFVDGAWMPTDRRRVIENPYDGELVGVMPVASGAQVREAARRAKAFRSDLTAHERSQILLSASAAIQREALEFVASICRESGQSVKDATKEIDRAAAFLRVCAEEAKRLVGEAIPTDVTPTSTRRLAVTMREPVGLVCAITPFNRPLGQVVNKLGPAIAANNSVILKPSEQTPLTAYRFLQTLLDSGLPPRMITIVTGDPDEIGDALVTSECVDMITFTGSAAVGQRIAQRAGMVRIALELGDSGALVVLDDADVGEAARAAAAGAFSSAGQSCRGVKRILVQTAVREQFVSALTEHARALKVGDPRDPATDIGTLITEAAAAVVEQRVNEALQAGARLVLGGNRKGPQYWPTVLDDVPRNAALVAEETFGPCAPIVPIRDLDDAIAYVNEGCYGLQLGIFTRDVSKALRAAREFHVGAVVVNGGPQFDSPNIPFGGVKHSGLGREGARYAIEEMTRLKTVVL